MLNSYLKKSKTPSNALSKLHLPEMDMRSNFQMLKEPCYLSVMESSTPMDFSYFKFSEGLQGQSNSSANKVLVLLVCSKAL